MTAPKEPTFLIEELFAKLTKFGKCPTSQEEFDAFFSNYEYEKILVDLMKAYGMI